MKISQTLAKALIWTSLSSTGSTTFATTAIPVAIVTALTLVFLFSLTSFEQTQAAPAAQSSANSSKESQGKQLFLEYCAACHGAYAKGDGPVGKELKTAPPDLTMLSARNGGKFPELKVMGAIKAGAAEPAHGSAAMPVWGPIFADTGTSGREREAQLKIYNLTEYIKTLQLK